MIIKDLWDEVMYNSNFILGSLLMAFMCLAIIILGMYK